MSAIFDVLPGIETPVGSINKSFADMWAQNADDGKPAPQLDDGKATQINLVIHLGFNTTQQDAVKQFGIAVAFSKRYPCRVVVLCPQSLEHEGKEMRAKIYGECHLGKNKHDARCCEFVILSYPMPVRRFLENLVSICLSTDLPLYYWVHRFSSSKRLSDYQYLLRRSRRVLYDTAVVPHDVMCYDWPKPEAMRDLAHARLLPLRQSIGQFLSSFAPADIVKGLRGYTLTHAASVVSEAAALARWLDGRLSDCGANGITGNVTQGDGACESFKLVFDYEDGSSFVWSCDLSKSRSEFQANFGGASSQLIGSASLLSPEAALGEAMFF